eukprot:455430-Prymnesium_polylepis.1
MSAGRERSPPRPGSPSWEMGLLEEVSPPGKAEKKAKPDILFVQAPARMRHAAIHVKPAPAANASWDESGHRPGSTPQLRAREADLLWSDFQQTMRTRGTPRLRDTPLEAEPAEGKTDMVVSKRKVGVEPPRQETEAQKKKREAQLPEKLLNFLRARARAALDPRFRRVGVRGTWMVNGRGRGHGLEHMRGGAA